MASHDSLVGFAYIFQVIVYPSHNRSWITPAVLIIVYISSLFLRWNLYFDSYSQVVLEFLSQIEPEIL